MRTCYEIYVKFGNTTAFILHVTISSKVEYITILKHELITIVQITNIANITS